jgi:DNA-binding transcriptional MerR regulator
LQELQGQSLFSVKTAEKKEIFLEPLTPAERSRLILASEFARLVGTSKTTLRYYDTIGLITPCADANHYHYYSPHQIYQFLCVGAFQEMGYALDEIRLPGEIPPDYLAAAARHVRENQETLRRQQALLEKRLLANRNLQRWLDLAGSLQPGTPEVRELNASVHLLCTPADGPVPTSAGEYARFLSHVRTCRELPRVFPFPFGRRFEDISRIPDSFSAYFSFSDGPVPDGTDLPAGPYLLILLTDSQEENFQTCREKLPAALARQGLRAVTPFYAMTLSTSGDFLGIRQHISLGLAGTAPA